MRTLSLGFLIRFILVSLVLGVIALIAGLILLWQGAINFQATQHPPAIMERLIHWGFKQSVYAGGGDVEVPAHVDLDDRGLIALGANHYAQNCSRCHGAPGLGQNAMVYTMQPRPQHMPSVVDQFEAGDFHFILEHGVKLSAMPAWPARDRDDEIWATVAFLEAMKADWMTPEAYLEMVVPAPGDAPDIAFGTPSGDREAALPGKGRTPWPEEYDTSVPSSGFADYALAGMPVAQCSTCHGTDGSGAPTGGHAANLTILSADYMTRVLNDYATGERRSAYMQVVASQLSSSQIDELAAYYDSLPDVGGDAPDDGDLIARGEEIASLGIPNAGTTACAACHGPDRATEGDWYVPALAGQGAAYMESRLRMFRAGGAGSSLPWSPMRQVAHDIDDADIEAVSAYYASIAPGSEPPIGRGDPAAAGQIVAAACSECHQSDMAGVPSGEFPNLTIQSAGYVLSQLHAFKTDGRAAERMQQQAYRLEAEEIAALATYVETLPPETREAEPVPGDVDLGRRIAEQGLPEKGVQACLTCHAPEVTDRIAAIPRLQGQYPKYILHRLQTFSADRGRLAGGDPIYSDPMAGIADALSDAEREAVAAYFGSIPPVEKGATLAMASDDGDGGDAMSGGAVSDAPESETGASDADAGTEAPESDAGTDASDG